MSSIITGKLITEYLETTAVVESVEDNQKHYYIEGIFMQAAVKNRNGRVYPVDILENQVNRYITEKVNRGMALGELNHPQRPNVDPREASHLITELRRDGNNFIGKARLLEGHPVGDIVISLVKNGVQLGVSSRGVGSLKSSNGLMEVQSDFHLSTVDVVSDPSGPDCFVNGIMESADWVWNGSAFTQQQLERARDEVNSAAAARRLDEATLLSVWKKLMERESK